MLQPHHIAHGLVYLYFAAALATPWSLYGAVPLLLALWGLIHWLRLAAKRFAHEPLGANSREHTLPLPDTTLHHTRWIINQPLARLLWAYALLCSILLLLHGEPLSAFDLVARFWLAPFALIILCRYPAALTKTAIAAAIGCFAALVLALWQITIEHAERAHGFLHVIQFGNLVLLQGLLCLTLATLHRQYRLLLLAAFAAALIASLLSGSRGGWIAPAPVALLLLMLHRNTLPRRALRRWGIVACVLLVLLVLLSPLDNMMATRLAAASEDIARYQAGDVNTSLGLRFEMWRSALHILQSHPLIGVGHEGIAEWLANGIAQGSVHPALAEFRHLHGDFIDAFARGGLLGGFALIGLFAALTIHYLRVWQQYHNPYALLGLVILIAFACFALSQSVLQHNSGVMIFLMLHLWCSAGIYSGIPKNGIDNPLQKSFYSKD